MLLACTKKLSEVLKIKLPDITPHSREPLCEWHANLFVFDRRKGVVMMNNQTRYCVVLYGLKAEHFKIFGNITLSCIKQTLLAEGFQKEIIEKYIDYCSEVVFTKTYDRSVMSQMNDMIYLTSHWIEEYLPTSEICMVDLNKKLGVVPVGSLKYTYPIDNLRKALTDLRTAEQR
ncbi:DUF6933 domain-containing protein [Sporomusa malonica]|uniref:DUF6933 domain-containing protein n=1 Tax=Sporomusa malonica TaxID=112901 RepID=A0A1W2F064_9FIRM|nr:hypothetical protein [Sporomusa malonica]SMD15320.1 hypothetical protein SAMN04488500_13715 [Sporomusa malonica]